MNGLEEKQSGLDLSIPFHHFLTLNRCSHEKRIHPRPIYCIIWGGLALSGCEKVARPALSPEAGQANQSLVAATPTEKLSPAQAAWLKFVDEVERGERIDPVGQYVAKGTQGAVDAAGRRVTRPKVDVGLRDVRHGYALRAGQRAGSTAMSRSIDDPCAVQNTDPCAPCYEGPGGCGGTGSSAATVFVSSESTSIYTDPNNPNGDIYDLKIVKGQLTQPLPGYCKIAVDLNRGAGGAYIYLTFTRRSSYVQLGDETGWGWNQNETSGPVRGLQGFTQPTGISVGWTFGQTPQRGFVPIWAPNPIPGSNWKHPDLNDGCGGAWIYAYQFKAPRFFTNPVEVGVIASNQVRPMPPAGWDVDYTQDLNEGAGGDYIYFCTKDK